MTFSKTKILCLTLIFYTIIHSSLSERCHPEDKKVLLQIKETFKTNNPNVLPSWDPQSDCCHWYGVKCHYNTHRVWDLYFNYADLSGPIPHQVGDLPYLEDLDFHKNPNLTGPVPQSITKLKRLRFLSITWTNVSGPIPDFIGDITSLEFIFLSFNGLSGAIPSSIGRLPKLTGLRLDRNKLTGPIPDSFGEFKGDDFYLFLSHNQLSGKIPASLGKKDFTHIDLSRNKLEGDASLLFGPDKKMLQHLDLSRNSFEFDLSKVEVPKSLVYLDLNHNKIFGSLPVGLTNLSLQGLNVSYNRLCGMIPVGGELQTRFDYSVYFHNRCLCGAPLPSCK